VRLAAPVQRLVQKLLQVLLRQSVCRTRQIWLELEAKGSFASAAQALDASWEDLELAPERAPEKLWQAKGLVSLLAKVGSSFGC